MNSDQFPEQHIDYSNEECAPFSLVAVDHHPEHIHMPDGLQDRVMIDVIHSGHVIPAAFLVDRNGETIRPQVFYDRYVHERDWGACLVARALASRLGLAGYYRVHIARALLDFGRFPGATPRGAAHMERLAINEPFSQRLSHRQKRHLLADYYDTISDAMERALRGKRIKFAVHTYDRFSPSGAERPEFSVITRSQAVERDGPGFFKAFDELYPKELGEFTADPVLRDRISLTLQKRGYFVEPNYPYSLPEGSVEVRAQVWSFFGNLRHSFEDRFPETVDDEAYRRIWTMLMDTNLRRAECEMLRSYLHMYRRVPEQELAAARASREAYIRIAKYLHGNRAQLVDAYQDSSQRISALGIEVRKDLLWEFDDRGQPIRPRPENAETIAGALAEGVAIYFKRDHPRTEPT